MPRSTNRLLLLAALISVGAHVAAQSPAGKDNNPSAAEKLLQLEADFARATAERGGEGFASFFADDAVTLPHNGKIATGRPKTNWKPPNLN